MSDTRIAERFVVQATLETSKLGLVQRAVDETNGATCLLLLVDAGLSVDDSTLDQIVADNALVGQCNDILLTTEWGRHEGQIWLRSEGDGALLGTLLTERARTDMPALLNLSTALGRALVAAGVAGVQHLDLGPHRVVLEGDDLNGTVRVAGFGWWRLQPAYATGATAEGFYGEPEFMAAEICKGNPATVSSDVYSAALVTWALAAGKPPFRSSQPLMTLKRQAIEKPLRLDLVKPALKGVKDLQAAIVLALDKKPENRPAAEVWLASLAELVDKFAPDLAGRATAAPAGRQAAATLAADESATTKLAVADVLAHKPALASKEVTASEAVPREEPAAEPVAAPAAEPATIDAGVDAGKLDLPEGLDAISGRTMPMGAAAAAGDAKLPVDATLKMNAAEVAAALSQEGAEPAPKLEDTARTESAAEGEDDGKRGRRGRKGKRRGKGKDKPNVVLSKELSEAVAMADAQAASDTRPVASAGEAASDAADEAQREGGAEKEEPRKEESKKEESKKEESKKEEPKPDKTPKGAAASAAGAVKPEAADRSKRPMTERTMRVNMAESAFFSDEKAGAAVEPDLDLHTPPAPHTGLSRGLVIILVVVVLAAAASTIYVIKTIPKEHLQPPPAKEMGAPAEPEAMEPAIEPAVPPTPVQAPTAAAAEPARADVVAGEADSADNSSEGRVRRLMAEGNALLATDPPAALMKAESALAINPGHAPAEALATMARREIKKSAEAEEQRLQDHAVADEAAADKAAADKAAADKAAADKAAADKAAADKAVVDKAAADKAAADKAAADKAAADKAAADKAAADKAAADKAAADKAAADKAAADKAAADKVAADKAAAEKAAANKAAADKAAAAKAAADKAKAAKAAGGGAADKAAARKAAARKAAAEKAAAAKAKADKAKADKAAAAKAKADRAAAAKAKAAARSTAKPAAGAGGTKPMTDAQKQASKMASLAQKSTNAKLKVLYLQKAVKADPKNAHYRSLLEIAQAELKAAQK